MTGTNPAFSGMDLLPPVFRQHRVSVGFARALLVAIAALSVLLWLVFVSVPPMGLSLEGQGSGEWVVARVPVAESAWIAGIRPGMEVEAFTPEGDPEAWDSLLVSDGPLLVTVQRSPRPPDALGLVPALIALLLAIPAYRIAPGIAWWLLALPPLASLAFASELVPAMLGLGLVIAPVAIGGMYVAEQRDDLPRGASVGAVVAVLGVVLLWIAAYFLRFDSFAAPRQLSAATCIALLGLGAASVTRQALWRARARLTGHGSSAASATRLLGATLDELIPGRSRIRLLAIEGERSRLANDLHADVMPELANVIRAADAGLSPTHTASRLRGVADDLRDLMTERRLSVLEELGLVPALEWLAERVEDRTNLRVEIAIRVADAQRAPLEVEMAAFRIAQQAIDNALVHASAGVVRLDLAVSGERVELDVSDDGLGFSPDGEARALRAGRLGLADMRARAAAIGGTLKIGSEPGRGTTAAFRWPA